MDAGIMEDQSSRILINLIRELEALCLTNMEYFQNGTQSHHAKFHVAFCLLYEYLDVGIEPSIMALIPRLSEYDVSVQVKGNGYRSLLRIVQKCCLYLVQLSRHIVVNRDSLLFRKAHYLKELEAYVTTMGQLRACLYYAEQVMNHCQPGMLFADEETLDETVADKLMMEFETLNQDCFYGRCLGFQFCESMQRPLQMLSIVMASFSEGYLENSQIMQLASSVFNSGKYIMNPDLKGKQIVNVTRSADIKFCKAFWDISETDIMQQLPSLVCPAIEVNEVLYLGPDTFELMLEDGSDTVVITPPCAHTGPSPVKVRLLSSHLRDGQQPYIKSSKTSSVIAKPKSPGLLVHCHGGGFVAQSSKSHEVYLRHWAREINVPILSIDYSLAPELPFPRALEECFYAYCWALQNYDKLGSTGKTIILAGDSAGANLVISTAMRAASFGVRCPDGIMSTYAVVLTSYTPSPSRLLALMDPLLPIGILSRCLAAYAGVSDEQLHGLTDPVFNSDAPYKLAEDEDSSDTEWIIVSNKSKPSSDSPLEGNMAGDANGSTSQDYMSAATSATSEGGVPNVSSSKPSTDSIVSPTSETGQSISEMTASSSEDYISAPETPSQTSVTFAVSDLQTEIDLSDNATRVGSSELNQSDLGSSIDTVHDEKDGTKSLVGAKSISGTCSKSSTPDPIEATPLEDGSGNKESICDLLSNCDSNTKSCPIDDNNDPAIMTVTEFITGEDVVILDVSRENLAKDQPKATSSKSCPDFKNIPDEPAPKQTSPAKNGFLANLKAKMTLNLPRTKSMPSFQDNRPRLAAMSPTDFLRHRNVVQSPLKAVRRLPIVKNPYMSPLLAPDELLLGLPEISMVACHLDPLLDDTLMFTKRLRKLGKKVDLELIDDLPHGFLNFSMVSKDAKIGSDLIINKIKSLFKMEAITTPTATINRPV